MSLQVEEANGRSTAAAPHERQRVNGQPRQDALYLPTEVRILVIDDEPTVSSLLKEVLARPGFIIDVVNRAEEVEAHLSARSYHLVILDYVVPGLDPEQVFEWLRREQSNASVIVVTGYPSMESVVSSLRARAYDYLTKPFDLSQLRAVVRNCLEAKGLLRLSEEALRETLGSSIRERRKGLGLTLAQMAERTNVSLGYLSQIELGKNSASIETLYRICLGLGIRMSDLFQAIRS